MSVLFGRAMLKAASGIFEIFARACAWRTELQLPEVHGEERGVAYHAPGGLFYNFDLAIHSRSNQQTTGLFRRVLWSALDSTSLAVYTADFEHDDMRIANDRWKAHRSANPVENRCVRNASLNSIWRIHLRMCLREGSQGCGPVHEGQERNYWGYWWGRLELLTWALKRILYARCKFCELGLTFCQVN
jgi:hypothetical protein